ncbi:MULTISPECIES: DUF2079 domain-containing protein [unclassified Ruminococcus]|uniref:DUF2079 domain-containing protein n=1 Tax=unclassified Ruminococcus TaxID=2608920 RepID=UPI00210AF638|nr:MULTISPECIES: DUF2079 domain-containing protein [unclassified Ruminococcus]MCQ4021911.1 DUF2079 domain-containing protein [Ruminococcus sp. zg-924]MCQ4115647.1 DUF2079 domain-containing protein [Ruminococcus sp. zg-921]
MDNNEIEKLISSVLGDNTAPPDDEISTAESDMSEVEFGETSVESEFDATEATDYKTEPTYADGPDESEFTLSTAAEMAKQFFSLIPIDYIFAALCAGFCIGSFMMLITTDGNYKELSFVSGINLSVVLGATVTVFVLLVLMSAILKSKRVIPCVLLCSAVLFGSTLAYKGCSIGSENEANIYMNIAVAFVMFFITAWLCKDDKLNITSIRLPKFAVWTTAGVGIAVFTVIVSTACISRYSAYMSHNFDLGVFAQMFENMRTTGLADTTVERNVLMSHFGVHFSPFYYLLLPFYMLCPRPETLLVIQAAFVALGVIPVVLICKHFKLSRSITVVISLMYFFFPSLANGCLYDFHENKFLTVLILWALYFIIKENLIGSAVFCLLTLTVKEDAPIYIMAIALFLILTRKKYIFGACMLVGAIIYFMIASSIVAALGSGIMDDRLANYMAEGESGLGSVVKTCLSNFGYFLSQVFTQEKIIFMVWMLLPVAFAPFLSEKKSMLVLFIPMLVVDLMPSWPYQYDIGFQYTYGAAALIIFMTIIVIANAKRSIQNKILIFSLSMSIVMSFSLIFPRTSFYLDIAISNHDMNEQYTALINTIPKDAEVTAGGYYIPHMYQFKNLYQYPNYYDESKKTEYLLVNRVAVKKNSNKLADFMDDDYKFVKNAGDMQLYRLKKH